MARYILSLLAAMALAQPAAAASSDWFVTDGARLRLIAVPSGPQRLDAALQIELEDGWKTYWQVPGGSGVPPLITVSDDPFGTPMEGATVTVAFPTPTAFSDGSGLAAGYKEDVAFPVTVDTGANGLPPKLHLTGMVGICAEVCIPVRFALAADLSGAALSVADEMRVLAGARASLPLPSDEVAVVGADGNALTVSVPDGTQKATWFDTVGGLPLPASAVRDGVATFALSGPVRDAVVTTVGADGVQRGFVVPASP